MTRISVCIATYNGNKYIRTQLASILQQLDTSDEIIVSDDGSTDNTTEIIKSFNDNRIKIVEGPRKKSPTANFENALYSAQGEYIFLADQDDIWNKNKVNVCLKYLKKYDCIISDATVVDGNLNIISDSFSRLNQTKTGKWYNLFVRNGYLGCCMAFRRKILDAVLPFPAKAPMHDIWIGNVAAFYFSVKFIPENLILFRRHGDTNSSTARKSKYSLNEKIKFRLNVAKNILKLK